MVFCPASCWVLFTLLMKPLQKLSRCLTRFDFGKQLAQPKSGLIIGSINLHTAVVARRRLMAQPVEKVGWAMRVLGNL